MFSQGYHPPLILDDKHPLLIVMAGLPGLGKSLLSNALSRLANTGRVCQDEVGDRVKKMITFFLTPFTSSPSSFNTFLMHLSSQN